MKYLSLFFLLGLLFLVPACGDDDSDGPSSNCDTENITYTNFVGDVLNESCAFAGCHQAGLPGFSLTTYDEVTNYLELGKMVESLRRNNNALPMPRDTATGMATAEPLPECTIDKIEAWIEAGTPE